MYCVLESDVLQYHCFFLLSFFFIEPATTEIYTLSLHDALPILLPGSVRPSSMARAPLKASPPTSTPIASASIAEDRKSTRLNSSHQISSYAVFCLKKKKCSRRSIPRR